MSDTSIHFGKGSSHTPETLFPYAKDSGQRRMTPQRKAGIINDVATRLKAGWTLEAALAPTGISIEEYNQWLAVYKEDGVRGLSIARQHRMKLEAQRQARGGLTRIQFRRQIAKDNQAKSSASDTPQDPSGSASEFHQPNEEPSPSQSRRQQFDDSTR